MPVVIVFLARYHNKISGNIDQLLSILWSGGLPKYETESNKQTYTHYAENNKCTTNENY